MGNISTSDPERPVACLDRPEAAGVRSAIALIFLLFATAHHAAPQPGKDPLSSAVEFLGVDEAFVLSARRTDGLLVVRWDMPDGYYLYRHAFSVQGEDARLGPVVIPDGQPKVDEYFGDSEVYYGRVELTVPINAAAESASGLSRVHVTYQGCADYGLCYPPQRRSIALARDGSVEIARSPTRAVEADVR